MNGMIQGRMDMKKRFYEQSEATDDLVAIARIMDTVDFIQGQIENIQGELRDTNGCNVCTVEKNL